MQQVAMVHVLWFDDEWGTDRQDGLGPWDRALGTLVTQGLIKLTCCRSVREFADELKRDDLIYGLLILDVMLTEETEPTYAVLGFADEQVIHFDGGAQIAELVRSSRFDTKREDWLKRYTVVPMLVLSASPKVVSLVKTKVGRGRMDGLRLVPKSLKQDSSRDTVEAGDDFVVSVRELIGL